MTVTEDIRYIGVNDHDIDLFEAQYTVPEGMSYNSYVILDEKVAVMDTVDGRFGGEWIGNLEKELSGRTPDYLVVQHMEPDHSANIAVFAEKYPSAKIVASKQAFVMMKQFFGTDYADRQVVAAEKDTLELGKHTLNFIAAPMVHWPEVMVTYDSAEKVLFSADAFGKFGTRDADEDWTCEARRYFFNIVGKYGAQVQMLLKKLAGVSVEKICALHGPVLTENLEYYIGKYDIWSKYEPEDKGVFIAYASIHGNTAKAAEKLKEMLEEKGCEKVAICDLCNEDIHEAVEDAFRYDRMVLAASTYDGGVFQPMETFLNILKSKNYQKRTVAIMENGSWAPMAARAMKASLETMKQIEILEPVVSIKSAMNDENVEQMKKVVKELVNL